MTFALAGIVGLVTYLQASGGGWKLPACAVVLIVGGAICAVLLQDQMAGIGQVRVLVGSAVLVGVLMGVGSVFGFVRHWASARTLALTSSGLTLGALWLLAWIGILT